MSQFTRGRHAAIDIALRNLIESSPQGLKVPNDRRKTYALADRIYNALPLDKSGEISQTCRELLGVNNTEFAILRALKDEVTDFKSERKRVRVLYRSLRRGLRHQQLVYLQGPGLRAGETYYYIRSVRQHERIPACPS